MDQLILNGIISGSYWGLVALGFALIYNSCQFFHFSHAAVFTSGAYFTYLFKNWVGLPIYLSIPFAIFFSAVLGCSIELLIYRPLRNKNASSIVLLLASLGVYILIQNIISLLFGNNLLSIRSNIISSGLNLFDTRITLIQLVIIFTSILLFLLVTIILYYTKIGKAYRAVASDNELANISGVNSNRIILWTFTLGSSLAGIAGILISFDIDMLPTMGMNALLMGVVAVIIGGVGSIPGTALGALFLGLVQQFGVWKISSQWQNTIAFLILFIFLLFRPFGFLGKKNKKEAI